MALIDGTDGAASRAQMRHAWIGSLLLLVHCASNASPSVPDDPTLDADASTPLPGPGDANASDDPSTLDGGTTTPDANTNDPSLCPDGFPRGVAAEQRVVVKLPSEPEGVAVCANGDVFVSSPNESTILRVPLTGGTPEVWTTLTGRQPLGMTCVNNVLYAVDFRATDAAVMRITAKDDPGTALPKIDGDKGYSALNAIASVPGLGLFASDASNTGSGRIVFFKETAPGVFQASVAKGGLAFPNGVAYEPKSKTLDVAFTLESKVRAYALGTDGALGSATSPWSSTPLIDAIDGIAIDENGAVYVAHYLQGFIGRSTDKAKVATAKSPKSLAFRGGTLLFTSASGLHAVDLGICGASP